MDLWVNMHSIVLLILINIPFEYDILILFSGTENNSLRPSIYATL